MPIRHIKLFFIILIISVFLSLVGDFFLQEKIKSNFIKTVPTILSALLAGLIASLSIIFSLSGGEDLKYIFKKDYIRIHENGENPEIITNHSYIKFLEALKNDSLYIFISLIISVVSILLYKITIDFNIYNEIKLRVNLSLTLTFFAIIISVGSMYDVISSLFTLNKLKYSIQKDILKEEMKKEENQN